MAGTDLLRRADDDQLIPEKLILHVDEKLWTASRWNKVGKPWPLASAILDATHTSSSTGPPQLIPLAAFLGANASIYTPTSLFMRAARTLVGAPLWWMVEQLSLVGGDDSAELSGDQLVRRAKGEYVVLANLETAADNVLATHHATPRLSPLDSLYTLASFKRVFGATALPGASLSDADVRVLVRHLARDKRALVFEQEVVKFAAQDDPEPQPVTQVDVGVLQMQTAVSALEGQVEEIQKQIAARTEKITTALRAGPSHKPLALSHLRSRKMLDDLLTKRLGALEVLQGQLSAVERAVGDAEIITAYELSTKTLRSALSAPQLQRAHVDATLEDMADALADSREIDEAIRIGEKVAVGAEDVEDELADELAALVKEAEAEKEKGQEQEEKARKEAEMIRREQESELERRLEGLRVPASASVGNAAKEQSKVAMQNQSQVA